ncbi:MAG TPA: DUF2637 domain-containing protein [Actinocrinis sp.]|nr:DUF2637 domain-containing protein [Actinocrinis sp.]
MFGDAAWAVPLLLDTTLAVLTAAGLILELNGLRARFAQNFARVLIGLTVYANVSPAHGLYARMMHGAPPVVWAGLTILAERTVRRLVGLASESRMEKVRAIRWLLAPVSTFRLWRKMRLWEITNYKVAIAREQQLTASRGLLREWHGRAWRRRAPRAELLAVRLQGTSDRPVSELLTESAEAIVSAARAALRPIPNVDLQAVLEPAPEGVPEVAPAPVPEAPETGEQDPPKPRPKRTQGRGRKAARGTGLRRTEAQLIDAGEALNQQAIAETGTPISLRALKSGLKVGQPTAERIRLKLIGPGLILSEPVPDAVPQADSAAAEFGMTPLPEWAVANQVVRVNGADLDSVVARL